MLNVKDVNRYFLRVATLADKPDLAGQVVYLRHVAQNGIVVSLTDDCRPLPDLIPLPATSNDNGWYDATDLIMDANCAITPRYDICAFDNETASQYRNHVDSPEALRVCEGKRAEGRLCFIGRQNGRQLEFSKTAYFVVSLDDRGFCIVYSGFCEPKKKNVPPSIVQRVLRLEGTGQAFFEAEPIVTLCNAEYKGDVALRDKFVAERRDRVAAASTATTYAADPKRDPKSLAGMQLD